MTQTGLPLQTSGFRVYTGVLVCVRLESLKFTGSPEQKTKLSLVYVVLDFSVQSVGKIEVPFFV